MEEQQQNNKDYADMMENDEYVSAIRAKRKRNDPTPLMPLKKREKQVKKTKRGVTARDIMQQQKEEFERFLSAIIPHPSEQGAKYLAKVKRMNVEDWTVQMHTLVYPLTSWGFGESIVKKLLQTCEVKKKDIYFQKPLHDNDEQRAREADENYKMFINYLVYFGEHANKIMAAKEE